VKFSRKVDGYTKPNKQAPGTHWLSKGRISNISEAAEAIETFS